MQIDFKESVTSTNTILLDAASKGEKKERALVAFCQTAGKGRKGRSFYSPDETGIYLSVLLFPDFKIEEVLKLTPLMAVAASKALEKYSDKKMDIKWVNDLYLNEKKIGGILTECSPNIISGIPEYIVIGIGINIFEPEGGFPLEIKDRAGSMFSYSERKTMGDDKELRKNIANAIIEIFNEYYSDFRSSDYLSEYENRLFIIGRRVDISDGRSGKVLGIDENFGLKLELDDGSFDVINAGEVSLTL